MTLTHDPATPHNTAHGPSGVPADDVFAAAPAHEQVVFAQDPASGLRAIIAVHSTALGPALGGTRFFAYASTAAALADVLELSRGMTYKAALAGLDLGGGKAVIVGDPRELRRRGNEEALFRAYGRFVESLGGRYRTACDVGTYSPDMDLVARETRFVTGRTEAHGGAGDSSVLTAFGVHRGLRAAARFAWGADGEAPLDGRRVGVSGVGKVGHHLVGLLLRDGAEVVVADVDDAALERVREEHPEVRVAPSTEALLAERLDVYSPCALGHAITDEVAASTTASIVCGAANNQLAHPGVADVLRARGVVYAPDYCVNAGGLVQVADELEPDGPRFERARQRAEGIEATTLAVLEHAAHDGISPAAAADRLAERRIAQVGRLRGLWVG